ncbi:MAG: HAMP domain-containing histidine kinase [Nitrospira sp.]|jgi:signal transduction histidine kinase|nr:HAMP domain-containing histidine kinase [Nitrospira sp.]
MGEEKERAAAAIARAQLELEEALAELDAMPALDSRAVALAAHMLNNYLTVTGGTVDLMQEHLAAYGDQQMMRWLEALQHVTNLMHRTVGQLMMNAPAATEPILRFERVELPLLLQRVCQYYQREADKKGIRVDQDVSGSLPLVRADRVILATVLGNLLSNAVKYSPPGTQIEVRVREENDWVRCDVQDQGPGLSRQDQAKLFQEGVRLTPRPTGGEPSMGYGLAVAKQLIEKMEGKISCNSVAGQGSCFSILVPQYAMPTDS